MYKYENEKSYRGDQNLNITKGAVPVFSLSIQRLCYVIGNIYLITTLTLVTVGEVSVKFPIRIW
jgi:hypothetical protein